MGIISSITSLGGAAYNTVTGGVSSAYNYVAPKVTTVVQSGAQTVQQNVIRPAAQQVQEHIIQPVQTQVIRPAAQVINQSPITTAATRVITQAPQIITQAPKVITSGPTLIGGGIVSGINLAPKIINTLAPAKTTILNAASIGNPVMFGMNLAPKIITSQPFTTAKQILGSPIPLITQNAPGYSMSSQLPGGGVFRTDVGGGKTQIFSGLNLGTIAMFPTTPLSIIKSNITKSLDNAGMYELAHPVVAVKSFAINTITDPKMRDYILPIASYTMDKNLPFSGQALRPMTVLNFDENYSTKGLRGDLLKMGIWNVNIKDMKPSDITDYAYMSPAFGSKFPMPKTRDTIIIAPEVAGAGIGGIHFGGGAASNNAWESGKIYVSSSMDVPMRIWHERMHAYGEDWVDADRTMPNISALAAGAVFVNQIAREWQAFPGLLGDGYKPTGPHSLLGYAEIPPAVGPPTAVYANGTQVSPFKIGNRNIDIWGGLRSFGSTVATGVKNIATSPLTLAKSSGITSKGAWNVTQDVAGGLSLGLLARKNDLIAGFEQNVSRVKAEGLALNQSARDAMPFMDDLNRDIGSYKANVTKANIPASMTVDLTSQASVDEYNKQMGKQADLQDEYFGLIPRIDAAKQYGDAFGAANASFSKNVTALKGEQDKVESRTAEINATGWGGVKNYFSTINTKVGGTKEDMAFGFIPNPFAKYNSILTPNIKATFGIGYLEPLEERYHFSPTDLVNRTKSMSGIGGQVAGTAAGFYAESREQAVDRPTTFLMELGAGVGISKVLGFALPKLAPAASKVAGAPGISTAIKTSSNIKSAIPLIGNVPTGKLVEYGMWGMYGTGSAINAMAQPTAELRGRSLGKSFTEGFALWGGGKVSGGFSIRSGASKVYDITGKAGLRLIETKPFQTGANALGGSWERAFGRISPGKVTTQKITTKWGTPGTAMSRTPEVKLNWNRASSSWEASPNQAKSWRDVFRVDRATWIKQKAPTYGEARLFDQEASTISSWARGDKMGAGTGWLNTPPKITKLVTGRVPSFESTTNDFINAKTTRALKAQNRWDAAMSDRVYNEVPGSNAYKYTDAELARIRVSQRGVPSREALPEPRTLAEIRAPRTSSRMALSDKYPSTPLETQIKVQAMRKPRMPSSTGTDINQRMLTETMESYNRGKFGTGFRQGSWPAEPAQRTVGKKIVPIGESVKIGQNRVYNYPLRDVRYYPSEGMVDAYLMGRGNVPRSPGVMKNNIFKDTDGWTYRAGTGQVTLTKPKTPKTPLSDIFGTGGGKSNPVVIAKEKPVGLPTAKEVAALEKEYGVETKGSTASYAESIPVYYPTSLDQPIRPGETMDAYGIPQPGARRRRVAFDEDSLVGVGPLALGGSGAVVSNLRENYESATKRERDRISGYSILPSITSIGETNLGLSSIPSLGELSKPIRDNDYKPALLPVFGLSPIVAQTPTVTSILSPQFDVTQIPASSQVNLQVPSITQLNLQIPDIAQTNVQIPDLTQNLINIPQLTQTTIQQPRLDLYQIEQPFIDIPPFEIPPLVIPPPALIIPPVNFPPLGLGGGGGGGGYGARGGFEFTETMPLGDFLSDVFGGAGMDFGGLGSGKFSGFGSGKVKMKKPRKVKAPGRKKKSK